MILTIFLTHPFEKRSKFTFSREKKTCFLNGVYQILLISENVDGNSKLDSDRVCVSSEFWVLS